MVGLFSYPQWISSATESGTDQGCGTDMQFTPCIGDSGQCYDANGNELSGMWSNDGQYDTQDRMSTDGYWTYGYDAAGNQSSQSGGGNTSSTYYDPVGNLRHQSDGSSNTVDFDIDYRNHRVGKVKNGSFSEGYIYDGDRIIAHVNSGGSVDAHYIYITKSNVPDAILTSGICGSYMMRVLTDQIGSVRSLWAVGFGASVQDYGYDAFGVATNWPTGSAVWPSGAYPFGFAGGLWDADLGLYRFGARDYNPWKGR